MAARAESHVVALRRARAADAPRLTAIAVRAKAHWGYEAALLELWRADLTFTPASIAEDEVWVAERDGVPLGVVAVSIAGALAELEALWVDPAAMGEGIGRTLFARATSVARAGGARLLVIASDPHAEGFYRRMGAAPAGRVAASPEGRWLPRLQLTLSQAE